MEKVKETKQEFINGLYGHCDSCGQTCSNGCLSYLTSTLKGDPCWEGVMRETTQHTITTRWQDRNVTRMLLKCEQLHDLDVLLLQSDDDTETNGCSRTSNYLILYITVFISCCMLRLIRPYE